MMWRQQILPTDFPSNFDDQEFEQADVETGSTEDVIIEVQSMNDPVVLWTVHSRYDIYNVPIDPIPNGVDIDTNRMEVERPYPFDVGGGIIIAIKRGDGDVEFYTLP